MTPETLAAATRISRSAARSRRTAGSATPGATGARSSDALDGPGGPRRMSLVAADGYVLDAHRFGAAGPAHARLIVAGATAVPQRHYRRFALHAAGRGFDVLTFDYRGIGGSAPADLRGFRMDYFDWGRLDLAAAVDAMHDRRGRPLYVVGHSYAGHGFGMLPRPDRVAAFFTLGSGAGWHGWMPPLERIRVLAMWHLLGPLISAPIGYLAWSRLGLGEDLPLDFYRQWKRGCRFPRNFLDDPALASRIALSFAQVRIPIMAANAIDDRWSPPRSRDAFMVAYARAARETLDLVPSDYGLRRLGHMGYFGPGATRLWDQVLDWLDAAGERRRTSRIREGAADAASEAAATLA